MERSFLFKMLICFYIVNAVYDIHSKKKNTNGHFANDIFYRNNNGANNAYPHFTSSSRFMHFVKEKSIWPYKVYKKPTYAQKVKTRITDKERRIKNMMSRGSAPVDINVLFYSPDYKRTLYTLYMHHPTASTAFDHHHHNIDDINYEQNDNHPIKNVVQDNDSSGLPGSLVSETAFSMYGTYRRY